MWWLQNEKKRKNEFLNDNIKINKEKEMVNKKLYEAEENIKNIEKQKENIIKEDNINTYLVGGFDLIFRFHFFLREEVRGVSFGKYRRQMVAVRDQVHGT